MPNVPGLFAFLTAITVGNLLHAAASAIRQGKSNEFRRHLVEDGTECIVYQKHTEFEDPLRNNESWGCEFSRDQAKRFGVHDIIDIEGVSNDYFESRHIVSGEAVFSASGAIIEESMINNYAKLVVSNETMVRLKPLAQDDPRHQHQRRLRRNLGSSTPGIFRTLVVKVIDGENKAVDASLSELHGRVFTDFANLKTQYEACSKGQMIIEPADVGNSGIVEVRISARMSSDGITSVQNEAVDKAEELYGGSAGLKETFDFVMFCQPPGSPEPWIAYAFINHWASFYNGDWCKQMSAQVHEVGHNLGLGHSGKDGNEYADTSDLMGYSYDLDDGPYMCFNAAKNYQLQWYAAQQDSIDPLDFAGDSKSFVLNGIDDYKKNGPELITLRLEQHGDKKGIDYYIGYNRASGPNRGTNEAANQVVIFEKTGSGPYGAGKSSRIADLVVGDTHMIENFKDTIYNVGIRWDSLSEDLKDATITVSTSDGWPTSAPTTSCGENSAGRFRLELKTDVYGSETTWELRERNSGQVLEKSTEAYDSHQKYTVPEEGSICLEVGGCYEFQIFDSFGDGMCCDNGDGYYRGLLDEQKIFEGGDFGSNEKVRFCVKDKVLQFPTAFPTGSPTTGTPTTGTPTTGTPTTGTPATGTPTTGYPTTGSSTTAPTSGDDCSNDPRFEWRNKEKLTCDRWAGKGKHKLPRPKVKHRIKKRCRKQQDGTKVWDFCPETCALVGLGRCAPSRRRGR